MADMTWLRPMRTYVFLSAIALLLAAVSLSLAKHYPLTAPSDQWFDALSQLAATVLGAGIATFVSWRFARASKVELEQAGVMHTMLKTMTLANNLYSLILLFDDMLNDANQQGRTAHPIWTRIRPTVSVPNNIEFGISDLQPFFTHKEGELANDLLLLAQRHNAFLATVRIYNELQFSHRIQVRSILDSGDKKEPPSADMARNELEYLAVSMLQNGRQCLSDARGCAGRFNIASKKIARGGQHVIMDPIP